MRLIGRMINLADRKRHANGKDGALGPEQRQRAVVMAGAEADAMAAPVERRERREQQLGLDLGRPGRRLGDVHFTRYGGVAGLP